MLKILYDLNMKKVWLGNHRDDVRGYKRNFGALVPRRFTPSQSQQKVMLTTLVQLSTDMLIEGLFPMHVRSETPELSFYNSIDYIHCSVKEPSGGILHLSLVDFVKTDADKLVRIFGSQRYKNARRDLIGSMAITENVIWAAAAYLGKNILLYNGGWSNRQKSTESGLPYMDFFDFKSSGKIHPAESIFLFKDKIGEESWFLPLIASDREHMLRVTGPGSRIRFHTLQAHFEGSVTGASDPYIHQGPFTPSNDARGRVPELVTVAQSCTATADIYLWEKLIAEHPPGTILKRLHSFLSKRHERSFSRNQSGHYGFTEAEQQQFEQIVPEAWIELADPLYFVTKVGRFLESSFFPKFDNFRAVKDAIRSIGLDNKLRAIKLEEDGMAGHCLFICISMYLFGTHKYHLAIRLLTVIGAIEKCSDFVSQRFLERFVGEFKLGELYLKIIDLCTVDYSGTRADFPDELAVFLLSRLVQQQIFICIYDREKKRAIGVWNTWHSMLSCQHAPCLLLNVDHYSYLTWTVEEGRVLPRDHYQVIALQQDVEDIKVEPNTGDGETMETEGLNVRGATQNEEFGTRTSPQTRVNSPIRVYNGIAQVST